MQYSDYTVKDFAIDEYFQRWVLSPDTENSSFWETWIAQNPEKEKLIEEARELVLLINFNTYDFPKDDNLKVWERINFDINEYENRKKQNISANVSTIIPLLKNWYKLTAIFLGLLILSSVLYFMSIPTQMTEHFTGYGETKLITLPDNSTIVLNSNSKIKYNSKWNFQDENSNLNRNIWLEGEAFFNVLKLKNSEALYTKFIVHTKNLDVEVLGTSFNVNNRRGKTEIVLNSGKVKINLNIISDNNQDLLMKPGELVEFSEENMEFARKYVNPELYSSWRNNKLIFNELPLIKIAQILEDNYGIKIIFENKKVAEKKFKGTFPANNIEVLLNTLSMSFNIKVSDEKDQIIFLE